VRARPSRSAGRASSARSDRVRPPGGFPRVWGSDRVSAPAAIGVATWRGWSPGLPVLSGGQFRALRLRVGRPLWSAAGLRYAARIHSRVVLGPGRIRPQGWARLEVVTTAPLVPQCHHDGVGDARRDSIEGPRPTTGQRRRLIDHPAYLPDGGHQQRPATPPVMHVGLYCARGLRHRGWAPGHGTVGTERFSADRPVNCHPNQLHRRKIWLRDQLMPRSER
jgi:hypothetical protein